MTRPLLPVVLGCLALTACGSPSEEDEQAPQAQQSPAGPIPEPAGFASTYTDFALENCEVLEENREEGSSADYRCPGFGDVTLFVQEGDGRFDLDAGIDDDGFQTLSAFNDIGDTIEWRLESGRPAAVIFRYLYATRQAGGRSVIAVETVGGDAGPGCRVAHVAGDTPDANNRARELADAALADGFICPETPELVGNAA